MDKEEIQLLRDCINHPYSQASPLYEAVPFNKPIAWYANNDTVMTVARILDRWGSFKVHDEIFDYFDKPWKWENDIREIIKCEEERRGHKAITEKTTMQETS